MFRSAVNTLMLAAMLMLPSLSQAEESSTFDIGIAPFLPISTFVRNYAPMTQFLSEKLGKKVILVSAPDYRTFYKRFDKYEYPLLITTASSAFVAWSDYGYIPLLQVVTPTSPVLVLPKGQNLKKLQDLQGKKIAMSDKTAVVTMQAMQQLQAAGLNPDKDMNITYTKDHKAAVNLLLAGEVDAAIISDRTIKQMKAEIQKRSASPTPGKVLHCPASSTWGTPIRIASCSTR